MHLGSILPGKFDQHAILVYSGKRFDPRSEVGYFSQFSSKSLYETAFKEHVDEAEIRAFLTKASLEEITKLLARDKRREAEDKRLVDDENQRQREQLEREKILAKIHTALSTHWN